MTKIAPRTLDEFIADAGSAASHVTPKGKLETKEKNTLTREFRNLVRDDKVKALEFLKTASPALVKFAESQHLPKEKADKTPREPKEPREPREPKERPAVVLEDLSLSKPQIHKVVSNYHQYEQRLNKNAPLAEKLDLYAFAEREIAVDNELAPQLDDLARFGLTPKNEQKMIESYRRYLESVRDDAEDHDTLEAFARSILYPAKLVAPPATTPDDGGNDDDEDDDE